MFERELPVEIPKPQALLVVHADLKAIKVQVQDSQEINRIMNSICERIAWYQRNKKPVIISRYGIGASEDEQVLKGIPKSEIIE